jgi:hypothetical protein
MLIQDLLVVLYANAGTHSLSFFEKTTRIGPLSTVLTSSWQWGQIGAPIGTMSPSPFAPSKPF